MAISKWQLAEAKKGQTKRQRQKREKSLPLIFADDAD
jgi:hypothetical protein